MAGEIWDAYPRGFLEGLSYDTVPTLGEEPLTKIWRWPGSEDQRWAAANGERLAVGDPDPTHPHFERDQQCGARDGGWMCTRPPNHMVDQHATGHFGPGKIAHVWDASPAQ